MSYILHIETSTKVCSVALSKGEELVALKEVKEVGYSHSENLTVFIQDVLEEGNVLLEDLSAISVSEGPGSYTGLRIGVSTAKGLCFSLNIPLIAIPALQVLANTHSEEVEGKVIPMMDARRNEVFSAVYSEDMNCIKETEAKEVDDTFYSEFKDQTILLVGDGASKALPLGNNSWVIKSDSDISAKGMVQLALEKFINQDFADTAYFEPFYLKDFVAGKPKKWF